MRSDQTTELPILRFQKQMEALYYVTSFLINLGEAISPVFTLIQPSTLRGEEAERWENSVQLAIDFVRKLHADPTLYVEGPDPLPVDPACGPLDFADHVRARLAKNHPLWDFIHAPFTHPLGTQFSLIFITMAWNSYSLLVDRILVDSELRPTDAKNFDTDKVLRDNDLLPSDEETAGVASSILAEELRVSPDEAGSLVSAGKYLRNAFVHRAGEPQGDLQKLVSRGVFSEKLIRWQPGAQLEVNLPMAGRINAVLIAKANLMQRSAIKRWPNLWKRNGADNP